jgi:glycosyltransferase involved in cell wall biosynthesis
MMKKIKVVHIVPSLGAGGAERMVVHIARGLDRQRFEVAVISIWRRLGSDLEGLLDESDVKVVYLGKGRGFDRRTYHRLHHVLGDYQPDIVHTHLSVLRYALPSLLLLKHTSMWLHTVNNVAEREVEPRARWIQSCAFKYGEVLPIAVSKEVAVSLRRLYGVERCKVIWNCVPTNLYACPRIPREDWRAREGFSGDNVLFVCVARFDLQKNHATLLKAFAQGPACDPKAHLVLVGTGVLQRQLEQEVQKLGLAGQVHFLGVREDIPDVLAATDVFVLSSDYEGSPLSIVEAMAAGLPIVSTRAGGVPELIQNGEEGFLVQVGDVKSLADCMTFLAQNLEARRSLGTAAARRARDNFDVSVMVQAYEEVYERLCGQLPNHKKRAARESFVPV